MDSISKGFILLASEHVRIRFSYYQQEAPVTVSHFQGKLPFSIVLFHARFSGLEIWSDKAPDANIIQENASVYTEPGEMVWGPRQPARNKTAGCMGIYYGEGRGMDGANIFARVLPQDLALLQAFGNSIWLQGAREVLFEVWTHQH